MEPGVRTERERRRSLTTSDVYNIKELQLSQHQVYNIYKKVEGMPYLLDDSIKTPYSFLGIVYADNCHCLTLGGPKGKDIHGLVWFGSIREGITATAGVALWGFPAFNRPDLLSFCLDTAFAGFRLHRIHAAIAVPNEASQRVVESLNFHREGQIREGLRYNKVWTDLYMYGLLRSDHEASVD